MKMLIFKNALCVMDKISGMIIAQLFGEWSKSMTTLTIFIVIDCIVCLVANMMFHNNSKGLKSYSGRKTLISKGMILFMVVVAYRLDLLIGANYIKNVVVIEFIVRELISLVKNAEKVGIPILSITIKIINILIKYDSKDNF